MINKFIPVLLIASFVTPSLSGNLSYECTIKNVYSTKDNGDIYETPSAWKDNFIGEKFYVSRTSGSIVGSTLPTDSANKVIVVNKGSGVYDFQSVAIWSDDKANDEWQVISIKEYRKVKSFIAFAAPGITTGVCK